MLGVGGRKQSFNNKAEQQIAVLASLLESLCILQAQPGDTTARLRQMCPWLINSGGPNTTASLYQLLIPLPKVGTASPWW